MSKSVKIILPIIGMFIDIIGLCYFDNKVSAFFFGVSFCAFLLSIINDK
jgi:hypothetical protein